MKYLSTFLLIIFSNLLISQTFEIQGVLLDDEKNPLAYANIALYNQDNTKLIKVETSNDSGAFVLKGITPGNYNLKATYLGFPDKEFNGISIVDESMDVGELQFGSQSIELETAVVKAQRAMVEVKADRTVFNVEGTINSAGDNGLGLLRKAPGVLVDNNKNVVVLGRSGVLFYVNGKRLPLSGDDLSAYLENIPAEQIDRIDIISNPSAKYEAEGNAGIIDIILKKQKNKGYNTSITSNLTQGVQTRGNINLNTNYRNESFNSYATVGYNKGGNWNDIRFTNYLNDLVIRETNDINNKDNTFSYRFGTDFFVGENHIVGFIIGGQRTDLNTTIANRMSLADLAQPTDIDSFLVADNVAIGDRNQNTFNLNYVFRKKEESLNIDLDYGKYDNGANWDQPNYYYSDAEYTQPLSSILTKFETPVDIDIYTAKIDYERPMLGGKISVGSKYTNVLTDNTFQFFDIINGEDIQNNDRSNRFEYSEKVIAGYVSYNRNLSEKINFTSGLRVEQTNSDGVLTAFNPDLQEPPVNQDYIQYFPNLGVTFQKNPANVFAVSYGRRINRPDYNVLNPFRTQLSEISFEKGNETLNPEIVNNVEASYTYQYRYNFKLAYSYTTDQITRLIGPDDSDPRASFISWDNLAEQKILNLNISAPFTVTKKWNLYVNTGISHIDNQSDYTNEGGGVVDIQAVSYNVFQQSTIQLGKGYTGEVSGYFSGPGVWGGVFKYDESFAINLGLQKRFDNRINVKLSLQDITYSSGWAGFSEFNGLRGEGAGNWDSRTVGISIGYDFGNNKLEKNRSRETGIDAELKRAKDGE